MELNVFATKKSEFMCHVLGYVGKICYKKLHDTWHEKVAVSTSRKHDYHLQSLSSYKENR